MDPYEVLASLGPLAAYRQPEVLREQWAKVQVAQDELKRRFENCGTDRERLLLSVEVSAHLFRVASQRACGCQLRVVDLGCEDLDIFWLAADWADFVQRRTLEGTQKGPDETRQAS